MQHAAVFGDVHGDADLLRKLIHEVRQKHGPDIALYSVGDLIDRGPSSKEVIQICLDEDVKALLGNHESWMRSFVDGDGFDTFALRPIMGGIATLDSYGVSGVFAGEIEQGLRANLPYQHAQFFKTLPLFRTVQVGTNTYYLFHAGLTKDTAQGYLQIHQGKGPMDDIALLMMIQRMQPATLMWAGDARPKLPQDNLYPFKFGIQVFGHTPIGHTPIVKPHYIALDTGCGTCAPYRLSAVILPTHEIVSVGR